MKIIARQGDLSIFCIEVLPEGLKEDKTMILVKGEKTHHAHKLAKGKVLKAGNGDIYLDVREETVIQHEEHKPIKLGTGKYFVGRQRQYESKDMTSLVRD